MKKCALCKEHKPVAEFSKKKGAGDGLQRHCKPCRAVSKTQFQPRATVDMGGPSAEPPSDEAICARNQMLYENRKNKFCPECGGRMRYSSELDTCERCHSKALAAKDAA